ncbi:MAG: hypothetical protein GC155_05710 [Alphaproteobacteria bacterium]|nr:hypothetical protein [Alphaproteobacteria bacterium]
MTDAAHHSRFQKLVDYLARIPAIEINDTPSLGIGSGGEGGAWWVRFAIDIDHELAWETVQEFGHALNDPSVESRPPVAFKPVSPPPHMNGGPEEFLSWVIEAPDAIAPDALSDWLEDRLPKPVDDIAVWTGERDEDDDSDDEDEEED